MGDRCSCTAQCRRQDVKAFEEVNFKKDYEQEDGLVSMVGEEINYALDGNEPAVPFTMDHSSGGGYSEGEVVSDGNRILTRETAFNAGHYVMVDGDGNPYPDDMTALKEFLAFKKKITQWMIETNIPEKS